MVAAEGSLIARSGVLWAWRTPLYGLALAVTIGVSLVTRILIGKGFTVAANAAPVTHFVSALICTAPALIVLIVLRLRPVSSEPAEALLFVVGWAVLLFVTLLLLRHATGTDWDALLQPGNIAHLAAEAFTGPLLTGAMLLTVAEPSRARAMPAALRAATDAVWGASAFIWLVILLGVGLS